MARPDAILYEKKQPSAVLSNFVHCYWHVTNRSDEKKVTILPDGYFDVLFPSTGKKQASIFLTGLATEPMEYVVPENSKTFAISFKMLAAEYILKTTVAPLVNKIIILRDGYLNDLQACGNEFKAFSNLADALLSRRIDTPEDVRKKILSELLYSPQETLSVAAMAEKAQWSSRQINRYFKKYLGLTLKEYSSILRYRAAFEQLKNGSLCPQKDYADQAHFIKEVKSYSGVTPKALAQNKDDRFIQFSMLNKT